MEYKTIVNSPTRGNLVSFQLSYSTADIERAVFHAAEAPAATQEPLGGGVMLLVHGELYYVDEQVPPQGVPFNEAAGLFDIIRAAEQNP